MSVRSLFALIVLGFTAASPVKKWYTESVGANYFQTNGFDGNQLVASYILPDGHLVAGSAVWTAGNGSAGINDPAPLENHADPFYSSGSVIVSGEQVFVVNAGSDSFSVFDIDPLDPARPQLAGTYPSGGGFPISLAASPDGKIVCVLNAGARNGFSCYGAGGDGWDHMSGWDRSFGLNLTTPPHGPVGNTPSQITFSSHMSSLIVVVKGQLPTDVNNASGKMTGGWIATYPIGQNMTLADQPVKTPAVVPFSINEDVDNEGVFFLSDVSSGFAAYNADSDSAVVQGTIPAEGAVDVLGCAIIFEQKLLRCGHCRQEQHYGDLARSHHSQASLDRADGRARADTSGSGTILSSHSLGVNASGTDLSVFSGRGGDWMYINAPAYHSVHAFKISGPGQFDLFQRFNLKDMSTAVKATPGFAGQAVYYRTRW